MLTRAFACSTVLCMLTAPASAATVAYSTPFGPGAVPFSTGLSLQKFDTTLGTLTSVLLALNADITGSVEIFNSTGSTQFVSVASASVPVTVTGPGPTSVTATPSASVANVNVSTGNTSFPGLTGTSSDSTNVAVGDFGLYSGIGYGVFALTAAAGAGTFSGSSVPGVFFSGNADVSGLVSVTYTYDAPAAVPLPAALPLFLAGLGMLGAVGRRGKPVRAI